MSVNIKELETKRNELYATMDQIREKDPSTWTAEDDQTFERISQEFDELDAQLTQYEQEKQAAINRQARLTEQYLRADKIKSRMRSGPKAAVEATGHKALGTDGAAHGGEDLFSMAKAVEQGMSREEILKGMSAVVTDEDKKRMSAFNGYVKGTRNLDYQHLTALEQTDDPSGGYLVAPQQWIARLIQEVDDATVIRQLATVIPLQSGSSIGVPTRDADIQRAQWTTELDTATEDSTLKFGKRELKPNPLSNLIKISKTLLSNAAISPESIARQRMALSYAYTMEEAYMTGDGNEKPLGLFVASNDGIPTSQDVNTGSATGFTPDGLINALGKLKTQYQNSSALRWLFHRDALTAIRKLKYSGTGEYIWAMGLQRAQQTILGIPVIQSEFVPNTYTNGNYAGMLADFSNYWIVDRMGYEVQRLVEKYALTNQIGLLSRMHTDGAPTLAEAFVRLKCAAAS